MWNLIRVKIANGEQGWEKSLPEIELVNNASAHAWTGCSPAWGFLGREVELPHLSLLPKFQDLNQGQEPFGLEEDIHRVWEDMRIADEVRIRGQFKSYLDLKNISRL